MVNDDEDASSLTSEESHEPYFNTRTGAIVTAREAWAILAQHDERYRAKLEGRNVEEYGITPAPSNDDVASLGPTQSSIDRALHPDYSPHKEVPRDDEDEETDPDILRAQAMALAAANNGLTPEQIMLIARPDVQQQKLIEETRKAKKQQSVGISQIGADIKKFIEAEKDKSASQWGSDLGKFIEEQSMKLQGTNVINATAPESQTKKKMEGFGSEPIPDETELDKKENNEDVRLSAVLWKRRSGLGKHSTIKAWEKRRVELRGSKLMYYETPEEAQEIKDANKVESESSTPATPKRQTLFEQAAQNAEQKIQIARDELSRMAQTVGFESLKPTPSDVPRGILDIVKEKAMIGASIGHSGSPTPFCISIKIKSETKWKFCFESHGVMMEWLTALSDVVVKLSVDSANEADGQDWAMQEYNVDLTGNDAISNEQSDLGSDNIITRTFSRQLTNESRLAAIDAGGLILSELNLKILLTFSNIVIFLSRSSVLSIERWWTLVVTFNFGMWQLYSSLSRSSDFFDKSAPKHKSISQLTPTKKLTPNVNAGTSCIKVSSTEDSNVTESGTKLPTWLAISSSDMEVRSRGYLTTKKKIPSPGELYECIAVDCFQSDNRYSEMAMRVVLPKVEFKDQGTKRWKSPDLFVVSISIPTEAPSIGKSTEDGPGTTVVGYFKMKESTRTILRRITTDGYDSSTDNSESGLDAQKQITNGVKLWEQYCKTAPTDSNFQARFKLIPQLNMQELGCPSYISKYNGKPVLIKRNGVTGFFTDYPDINTMEFNISLHPFPYLFKQGMAYIKDNYFDKAIAKFGFVIEGRSDDELPEVVLGAMQVCYPNPKYVMSDKDFFGKGNQKV